jgi:hypothetical protein
LFRSNFSLAMTGLLLGLRCLVGGVSGPTGDAVVASANADPDGGGGRTRTDDHSIMSRVL